MYFLLQLLPQQIGTRYLYHTPLTIVSDIKFADCRT